MIIREKLNSTFQFIALHSSELTNTNRALLIQNLWKRLILMHLIKYYFETGTIGINDRIINGNNKSYKNDNDNNKSDNNDNDNRLSKQEPPEFLKTRRLMGHRPKRLLHPRLSPESLLENAVQSNNEILLSSRSNNSECEKNLEYFLIVMQRLLANLRKIMCNNVFT